MEGLLVGIVVVSHGEELARGVVQVASQMAAGQQLMAAAGGLEDGSLGTSLERIQQALDTVYSEDGVLILMDLGSAVMTTEMLLESLPADKRARVRMSNAPLVEGAIAAAVAAAQGADLDAVQRAAETAMDTPKVAVEAEPAAVAELAAVPTGPVESVELVVPNPVGLHARPAVLFVRTALSFGSQITVQNVTRNGRVADAKSMMQVGNLAAARQGETIRIVARGEDARQAVAALSELVKAGFGEMEVTQAAPARVARIERAPAALEVPAGPPPPRFQGIGVSEGLAVAPAFVYRRREPQVTRTTVANPVAEVERLQEAIDITKDRLHQIRQRVAAEANDQTAQIFDFHRMMLEDSELVGAMKDKIRRQRWNAEAAVDAVISDWAERFDGLQDEVMRARAADVRDVGNRVLAQLAGAGDSDLSDLPGEVIVVANDLVPSQTALLDRSKVRGIATALGGETSHTAILARMLGIPAVAGLGAAILAVSTGTRLGLDGETGVVEVNPSPEVLRRYQRRQERLQAAQAEAQQHAHEPALTLDGRRVEVVANIGDVASAQEAVRYGAEGVGLLRTEFLYLGRSELPDEEEQFAAYRAIAQTMGQRALIVRTLDVGGDKQLPYLDIGPEQNPFLGVRAIRLSLQRPDIFQPQLRAILRAGAGHHIKIMFPMVATRDELLRASEALNQARSDLRRGGQAFAEQVEVGIMVEVPAAAIVSPVLAPEVDFFSIGSNDLTQYTLAADRGNEKLAYLYHALDPSVLHLIRMVIEAGHGAGKWVGLCGELAGQPAAIPILLGLGLDEFSMTPRAIPLAKQLLRKLRYEEMVGLAAEVLTLATADQVEQRMARFLREMGEE